MNFTPVETTLMKMGLIACAISFLWLGRKFTRSPLHLIAASGLLISGVCAWWSFSPASHIVRPHIWEQFHYVLTAKYFDEVRYDALYRCALEASYESGPTIDPSATSFRDLVDNRYRSLNEQIDRYGGCRSRFQSARWAAWVSDVTWFRTAMGEDWKRIFFDHGCNASPLWLSLGRIWIHDAPVSDALIESTVSLDVILLLAMWLALTLTCGVAPTCIAAVLWGTNVLGGEQWTGGAFLRKDWFAAIGFSIALLRTQRVRCAGGVFGYAIASRILPIVTLCLLVLLGAKKSIKFCVWGLVAIVVALAISSIDYGIGTWLEFLRVLVKHQSTEGGNVVGLNRLITNIVLCRFGEAGNSDGSCSLPEFHEASLLSSVAKGISLVFGGGVAGLMFWRLKRLEAWEQLAFCSLSIILFTDVASYDTELFAFAGLLAIRRPFLAAILLLGQLIVLVVSIGGLPGNSFYLVASGLLVLTLFVALVNGDWNSKEDQDASVIL